MKRNIHKHIKAKRYKIQNPIYGLDENMLYDLTTKYKEEITKQNQIKKAIEIEDRIAWAQSEDLPIPKVEMSKVKRKSLVSFIKIFSL